MEKINKVRIKLNFDTEGLKNNPDYYQIKREIETKSLNNKVVIIDLGKKLNEIALEYMDKYIE